MAAEQVIGRNEMIPQPVATVETVGQGKVYEHSWIGPQALVDDKAAELRAAGYTNIRTAKGVPGKITATYSDSLISGGSDSQQSQDADWELLFNIVDTRIENHANWNRCTSATLGIDLITAAKKADTIGSAALQTTLTAAPYVGFNLEKLATLIAVGDESYMDYQRIIRRTITTNRKTLLQASTVDILRSVEYETIGVPSDFERIFNISAVVRTGTLKGVTYRCTWLKMPPQVRRMGRNKYTIQQEWWEGFWTQQLYMKSGDTDWSANWGDVPA